MRRLHARLPFPLTKAQDRVIMEIRHDMLSTHRMNRLLHGDVGSGKTLVALSAMLLAVEAGFQAAIMAPTQILAEQHYLNFRRLLEPLGISVALRTGARKEDSLLPLFDTSGAGAPQIFVGTHALLYDDEATPLARLGLVVIDEQHKFGVLQRARLRERAAGAPDVLVMTATPIPRTLTMTLYGDLDISVLDELPRNRGKIVTAAREPSKLPRRRSFCASISRPGGRRTSSIRSSTNRKSWRPKPRRPSSRNGASCWRRCPAICCTGAFRRRKRRRSWNASAAARRRRSSRPRSSKSASTCRTRT
jgi:ATP-dependent DNA helicase RecG